MRIAYLMESTILCGGVKVVFDQARALTQLGHDVQIFAKTGNHSWYPYPINVQYHQDFDSNSNEIPEVLICTYYTTVMPALKMNIPLTFHLCQGYEGDISELKPRHPAIEEAYKVPFTKLTVGEWLSERLQSKYGEQAFKIFTIGQVVDTMLFKPLSQKTIPNRPPQILVVGDYRIGCKGVGDALQAIALLRKQGKQLHLVRVSTENLTEEEKSITQVNTSFTHIPPAKMAAVYQNTDVFIAPNLSAEGFGLPLAEALASGVPAVATRIPSYLSFDNVKDYAYFVPEHAPSEITTGILTILQNDALRRKMAQRGPAIIQSRFAGQHVARRILSAIAEVEENGYGNK